MLVGLLTSELTALKRINDPKAKHEDYGHFAMVAHRQIPIRGTPVNRDSGPPSGATLTAIEDNALEKAECQRRARSWSPTTTIMAARQ